VYDPFPGSGTMLIAAELTERVWLDLELDPEYMDVIVTRWQNLTGKRATLAGNGRAFAEAKATSCAPSRMRYKRKCSEPKTKGAFTHKIPMEEVEKHAEGRKTCEAEQREKPPGSKMWQPEERSEGQALMQ
jgi:hypothetical protein